MNSYKCQQCGGLAEVLGEQAIDQYKSPCIVKYVVCTKCGYIISKDKADCENLLAACLRMIVGITKQSVPTCDWYEGIEYDGCEEAIVAIILTKISDEDNKHESN